MRSRRRQNLEKENVSKKSGRRKIKLEGEKRKWLKNMKEYMEIWKKGEQMILGVIRELEGSG